MSATANSRTCGILNRRLWLALLMGVHLPFVLPYFAGLWERTHYQFFPFAIGTFVWLFVTRRSRDQERWTWLAWLLVAVDVLCVVMQFVQSIPWLAAFGFAVLLTAWCFVNRDAGFGRRLTYLALLPWLVVRLPLQYDQDAIHWLQRVTTAIASNILHRARMLHFREGNILQFPGRSFEVQEACSGVQSLFTVLFIAALVVCLKRRSVIHAAALLASGLLVAGIMNIVRVISIAFVWQQFSIDWSAGLSHDVLGYVCLIIASMMLMSGDAFVAFLTDPVPDMDRPGRGGQFLNPLILYWNRLVAVIPGDPTLNAGASVQASASHKPDASLFNSELRERPSGSDLLEPGNWFHFFLGWGECWLFSRDVRNLLAGIPFAAASSAGIVLALWVRHASDDSLLAHYEATCDSAAASGDKESQGTALRALCSLRPGEPQYRFRLGQFLVESGQVADGLAQIMPLATEKSSGSAEARMWLVRQAMQPNPLQPLSLSEIERHLSQVLKQIPQHIDAHQMLAQIYSRQKEWKLAETHLSKAAAVRPTLNLPLAKLCRMLDRNDAEIQALAEQAVIALTEQLEQDRTSSEVRIDLAEALLLAGQDLRGREVLLSGLQQSDDAALTRALSDFDLRAVDRRLAESALNRDVCIPVVVAALQRDPSNISVVQMVSRLQAMGAEFAPESFAEAISCWQRTINEVPSNGMSRVVLGQLLLAAGDSEKAAETIRPSLNEHPELRLRFARVLIQCGRKEESSAILTTLIGEAERRMAKDRHDISSASELAEALLVLGRADDARQMLLTFAEGTSENSTPREPELAHLFGRASIDCYDRRIGFRNDTLIATEVQETAASSESQDAEVLLELLTDALGCPVTANEAIDRLAALSLSSHAAAPRAEEMIGELRLEGTHAARILNLLGMHASLARRFDRAKVYLEQANAQTRGRDAMILNNLAIAIIRGGGDTKERALQLANETLLLLPDHPDALSTRGEIYVAMERWQEAAADLTESLKLRQNSSNVHRLLATTYAALADTEMAERHRQRAAQLESGQH
jgi:exosortase